MGATVTEQVTDDGTGSIHVKAGHLQGGTLYLDTPSHTGTENLIMAASLAHGTTLIKNCALEPEVLDVIQFVQRMGARVTGGGTGFITVEGVYRLTATQHTVMPDRIDAGVLVMAAAITGGEISLVGASLEHLGVAADKLEQMGVEFSQKGAVLRVRRDRPLRPINVITDEYPGFATDLQSPIMAVSCLADGPSYIYERIFDGRFKLADELVRMGADIEVNGNRAKVNGATPLRGAEVVAHDLRTGSALVLAGLVAEGETTITNGYYLDRGHSHIAGRLNALGADIERLA
jgi:UDP-N-acetylglucosamine 1-carboxyvinyltransferase